MIEIAVHRAVLERLGLGTLEGVRNYSGGTLVKDQRGRREIRRIDASDESGAAATFFLKRIYKPYKKDGLCSLLKRGRVWSLARQEWHNMQLLNRHGFPTAELVAFGEEVGPFWERFSFIVTKGAPAERTVEDFLKRENQPRRRRALLGALARHVRAMHDARLASPDLFARHFFVADPPESIAAEGASFGFFLIDMARLDHPKSMTLRLRARDLAALHASLPMHCASRSERMRFFRDYCRGTVRRDLIDLILLRTRQLLMRSKFEAFDRAADRRG